MKNGQIWYDVDGNDIQAHGGCIIKFGNLYYWYGEHKGGPNVPNSKVERVDVIGVSCYTSQDLVNWKYEGLALEADKSDPESPLHPSKVLERPKVLYNEKTGKYVMWFHSDRADYQFARAGVAISDNPKGPFVFLRDFTPNKQDSRDMTVYKDKDGVAYLFHSANRNKTMNVARLTEDYTNVDGLFVSVLPDQEREAPALFFYDGMYYMISSGCTSWNPNAALYAECPHLMGKWKLIDNPLEGKDARITFYGQSAYIFEAEGAFYLMLDHWKPDSLRYSGYSILPIKVNPDKTLTVPWQEEWLGI
ncbi:MAG: family 43 glycosylhydrolase [Clostridia bacterium]|nr:family 43 glycosylhydrolase [Clostridia bacterium]